ncbi:MAG: DUF1684 domain-containing protein [Actinocatenispora sp.]
MSLTLLGWRREVAALYARVRAEPTAERGWLVWRRGRDELFAAHPDSPLAAHARGAGTLRYAPYDPALRWELAVHPTPGHRWEVPTGTDGVVPFERIGTVRLPSLGSLDVWWLDTYAGGVFVPLRDTTAGTDSYGGGRYLLDTAKGADLGGTGDRLVLDLNFAYNPSCAYDPAWACPLAPPGNRLAVPVRAGELLPLAGDDPVTPD